jgi:2-polyprenyl-3-methyl-5-hydroxy-6-metoxy-1,4-benzoquinol methylase
MPESTTNATDLSLIDAPCPVCDSRERIDLGRPGRRNDVFRRLGSAVDEVRNVRCTSCTALYVAPMVRVSGALQREIYNIGYFTGEDGVLDLKNMGEKENLLRIVDEHLGGLDGRTMLDIGCGTGEYLKAAKDRGMRVTGIDVDQSLADHIQLTLGAKVVVGLFSDDTFPKESFDLIVLSHVIEHVPEPVKLLRSIYRALKPGGLFLMATPDFDAFMEFLHNIVGRLKFGRDTDHHLTPFSEPFHVVGFNRRSARHILKRTGFRSVYFKVHSGFEWASNRASLPLMAITLAGATIGRGMALNTISRKL